MEARFQLPDLQREQIHFDFDAVELKNGGDGVKLKFRPNGNVRVRHND